MTVPRKVDRGEHDPNGAVHGQHDHVAVRRVVPRPVDFVHHFRLFIFRAEAWQ